MRIPRRPAWPVVFLLASAVCTGGDPADLGPLEALSAEIGRWKRIRRPEAPQAMAAFVRSHAEAAARWVERWPGEELAWRERLRALAAAEAPVQEVEQALAGAAAALGRRPALRFPEDTRFWMARAAVRHAVRLEDAPHWVEDAVQGVEEGLPAGDHPLVRAYRQERLSEARWRAGTILAELAYRSRDAGGLASRLAALTADGSVPVADPADRIAAAERARRRTALFLWRARLARLQGDGEEAELRYRQALEARPTAPGEPEPEENLALLEEAERFAGLAPGNGSPIPPANRAAPHWLQTSQPLDGFVPDGRPAVAAAWDGTDPRLTRAIERLERRGEAQVLSITGANPAWVSLINPLYAAPQLWVVDASGVIRLVGRFQPGSDGWEDAVVGAAMRLPQGPRVP